MTAHSFEPRCVCISGGTSGIGAGLVAAFLATGALVYTCGRSAAKVAHLKTQWAEENASGQLVALVGDVTDAAFVAELVAIIAARTGYLDVLVHNAGVILASGDLNESVAAWRATLETNLIAPFALTQASCTLLERSAAPVVINLSSACAQRAFSTCTSTSYSVSKAGLDLLTQRLALALAPRGIRVNGVAPGVVASALWGDATELMAATVAQRHVLKQQIVTPADVAAAVLFLASAQARFITGTTLNVDSGYTLG
jgi:NAD(P)-dependent dehydrogenase (short-subunit alcohol dehydrogenase family)